MLIGHVCSRLHTAGAKLTWLGPGRLGFSVATSEHDFGELRDALLSASSRMLDDGWWVVVLALSKC